MVKKALYIIGVTLLVLFMIQNSVHVPIAFMASTVHFRAVFLMGICFGAGFVVAYYFVFRTEEVLMERIRKLKLLLAKERAKNKGLGVD